MNVFCICAKCSIVTYLRQQILPAFGRPFRMHWMSSSLKLSKRKPFERVKCSWMGCFTRWHLPFTCHCQWTVNSFARSSDEMVLSARIFGPNNWFYVHFVSTTNKHCSLESNRLFLLSPLHKFHIGVHKLIISSSLLVTSIDRRRKNTLYSIVLSPCAGIVRRSRPGCDFASFML